MINAKAHALTIQRALAEARGNLNPSATTSVMKNSGNLDRSGARRAGRWRSWARRVSAGTARTSPRTSGQPMRSWLGGKATTIFGGSQEIQSNIVSKRILGLPDTTQST